MRKAICWVWWSLAVACGVNLAPFLASAQTPIARDNNPAQSAPDVGVSPYHVVSSPVSSTSAQQPQWLPVGPHSVPPARRLPPSEPYVTTCLVSTPGDEPARHVASAAPSKSKTAAPANPKAAAAKSAVERACGLGAANVRVVFQDDNKATIHLTAATEPEARVLWEKIQALPELLPYSLDVDVQLRK